MNMSNLQFSVGLPMDFRVHDDRSEKVTDIKRLSLDPENRPSVYHAPVGHPYPQYRADVRSVVGDEIIVNPRFTTDMPDEWADSIFDRMKHLSSLQEGTRTDIRDLVHDIEYCIPEFRTQLVQEEIENLQSASREEIEQVCYAFERLFFGEKNEEDIEELCRVTQRFFGSREMDAIQNDHVRERLLQCREFFRRALLTEYRNALYVEPMKVLTSEEEALAYLNTTGRVLADKGEHYYSFRFEWEPNTNEMGSHSGTQRHFFINSVGPDIAQAQTILHESLHAIQTNESMRRIGIDATMSDIRALIDWKEKCNTWNATYEVEAGWLDAQLLDAQIKASGLSFDQFCTRHNVSGTQKKYWDNLLLLLNHSPKRQSAEIPKEFCRGMFLLAQRNNKTVYYQHLDRTVEVIPSVK